MLCQKSTNPSQNAPAHSFSRVFPFPINSPYPSPKFSPSLLSFLFFWVFLGIIFISPPQFLAMTAPNIEMIADSLRNCSLRSVRSPAVRSPAPPRRSEESVEVTVELNSEVALPYHWEQCLDMRTGQVYYRNWRSGRRTTVDPRLADGYNSSSSSDDEDSSDDDDDDSSNEGNRDSYFSGDFSGGDSSSSSSAYSPEIASAEPQVLVAAGCRSCFMYFMVPKQDVGCPKCGRLMLHLGRSNGCF